MKNKPLFFLLAFIFVVINGFSINAQSCNCLPGWQYRLTITISNNNPSAYSNIEVRNIVNTQALISAGKMRNDCGDIRFFDTLCSPLNYFLESGINTASTVLWVKVPHLPANGTRTIYMYYGNSTAVSQSSGVNTFSFFEGFDFNLLGRFGPGPVCSSGTPNVSFANGLATFSWTASSVWLSDSSFPLSNIYTAEANVTSASGNFPGVYWARSQGTQSMAVLMGSGNVRISKAPISGTNNCVGHNFIPPIYPVSNPAGIWGFTWVANGNQVATFPGVGTWSTSDNELPKDQSLRLGLGGISTGTGSYTIDWVRARKYAPNSPTAVNGSELSVPAGPGSTCLATPLSFSSIRVNWTDNASNEDKYRIEKSTDGGSVWILKDSVPANTTQYTDTGLQPVTQYCYRVYAVNCFGISANSNAACATTSPIGIVKQSSEIPAEYNLYQNYPNPFNPVTNLKFDLPKSSFVKLVIYDALGRQILILVNQLLSSGVYTASWNAETFAGGIYFCRIEAGQKGSSTGYFIREKKMVLLK
jgi:hypothetical protein